MFDFANITPLSNMDPQYGPNLENNLVDADL